MKDLADLRFRRKFDRLLLIEMLGPLDIYKVRAQRGIFVPCCMALESCFSVLRCFLALGIVKSRKSRVNHCYHV